MVGIDTNILIRYLTGDDKEQYQKVLTFLRAEKAVYISPIVWVETVWVLTHCYRISVGRQCEKLGGLLDIETFIVDSPEAVLSALAVYQQGYDFADAMIGHSNAQQCETTWTFDKKAARLNVFSRLQ